MEYVIGIFIIVTCVLGFIIYNLLRKLESAADMIDELIDEQFATIDRLKETFNNLKEIDSKGGFESDDEIGQTFQAIKDEIEKLEGIYDGEDNG